MNAIRYTNGQEVYFYKSNGLVYSAQVSGQRYDGTLTIHLVEDGRWIGYREIDANDRCNDGYITRK